jgi:hypothetical protein
MDIFSNDAAGREHTKDRPDDTFEEHFGGFQACAIN